MLPARIVRTTPVAMYVAAALLWVQHPARAATATVTKTTDDDGACRIIPPDCSLREALLAVNPFTGGNTIHLPAGTHVLSIPGTGEDGAETGDLDVLNPLTIEGEGSATTIIDAAGIDRVFDVHGSSLTLRGVTIRGGAASASGGGVGASGDLTLEDVVVVGNTAGSAGGLFLRGSGSLTNVRIEGNTAADGGGLVFLNDDPGESLVVTDSTIVGNSATFSAGGLDCGDDEGEGIELVRSTVSDNRAGTVGGGMDLFRCQLEATDSAIARNLSGTSGGGVSSTGPVTIINGTLSGNEAGGAGGGIHASGSVASITLVHTTVTSNVAAGPGGAVFAASVASVTFSNSLLVGDCAIDTVVDSTGGNLESPFSTCGLGAGDQVNVADPMLADLGYEVPIHLPLSGSPAIDAAATPQCVAADARGNPRPLEGDGQPGALCDVGAVEVFQGEIPSDLFHDGFESGDTSSW